MSSQQKRSIFDDSDEDGPCNEEETTKSLEQKVSSSIKNHSKKTKVKVHKEIAAKIKEHTNEEYHAIEENEPLEAEKIGKDAAGERTPEKLVLTPAQRALMEQKRQQALLLKRDKINRRNPYVNNDEKKDTTKVVRINNTKLIDSGGGFFIEENEDDLSDDMLAAMKVVTEPAPLFEEDRPHCLECDQQFNNSFLFQNFDHPTCDQCRDTDDKHCLITKTDAKNEYLLKDVDFDQRKPPLKFIVRKNPHNSRWGDMKLYLKLQVEKRALEVWESEEALEEALEKKDKQRESNKQKKYNKKMKELRMSVRSSLYTRASKTHEHEYGEEVYLSDEDEYSRTCTTCGHSYTYDKL
ncbi:DNA repair protein complementing XP-A cells isoform X2 [Procambarus clarkii]|uniref:DNA repair protein complementing XP-A cells isoform X2 n=1 Tax=Procambarus clarkii TaxID=6728 RepID=UPI00374381D3